MIPHSWRVCEDCGSKQDVDFRDGHYRCFGCRSTPEPTDDHVVALAFSLGAKNPTYNVPGLCNCGRAIARDCSTMGCDRATSNAARRLAIRLLPLLAVLALLGCSVAPFTEAPEAERFGAVARDFPPGSECVLLPEVMHAPAGDCYEVTADEWSTLATCEGTTASEYVGKTWTNPTSYPTSSFQIPGGGCYQFYNCTPEGVLAPEVEPCR